jgi:hypothetical protein
MEWAAWGPTIVSIAFCIFSAGVLWSTQLAQGKRIDAHDTELNSHTRDITTNSQEIEKLKSFQQGYAAARAIYEGARAHTGGD